MSSWAEDVVGVVLRMAPFEQRCGLEVLDTSGLLHPSDDDVAAESDAALGDRVQALAL